MDKQASILAEIFRETSKYVLEGGRFPRFSGDRHQVEAIKNATLASRRLYEALCDENSTLDTIATRLEERRIAAENFRNVTGRDWRF
jgi:hypothetical protein